MSHPHPLWLTANEQRAWRDYLGSHARLLAELHRRLLDASGLAIADYEVLVHISEADEHRLRSYDDFEAGRFGHLV